MSEKEAWKKIGLAFHTPYKKKGKIQRSITWKGMCFAIKKLRYLKFISAPTRDNMNETLLDYGTTREYWLALTEKNILIRADFCMLMYYSLGGK